MKTLFPLFLLILSFASPRLVMATDPTAVGSVVQSSGKVWIVSNGKRLEAKTGQLVFAGDRLRTSDQASVTVRLGSAQVKDSAFHLIPNSEVTVSPSGGPDWELKLDRGGILSVVKNPEHRPNHYRVRTKTAVMGVRGTGFFVKSNPGEKDFLCTCHGKVNVKATDADEGTDIESQHHDFPKTLTRDGKQLKLEAAPVGDDHSDVDGAALGKWLE